MVQHICEVVAEYEKCLQGMPFVPKSSHGRAMLWEDGAPNKIFLTYLLCDQAMAIQFLKDMGLLRSNMKCNTCGRDILEGFRWRCRRKVAGAKCSESRSVKHGSWFQQSKYKYKSIDLLQLQQSTKN